jgi:small subunit ribosomal protein S14
MAKKCSIAKQKRREQLVKSKWDKRQELKKIVMDLTVSDEDKVQAQIALDKLPKNSSLFAFAIVAKSQEEQEVF